MPRFFVDQGSFSDGGKTVTVTGDDAVHISRVLRMKCGDELILCDGKGTEYRARIRETGSSVVCDTLSSGRCGSEPPYRVTVYQSLVKGDRFDTVLQKGTELGATDFVPVITSRCVVTLDEREYGKKLARWQRIAYEASKQCGRGIIPVVREPMRFEDAVKDAAGSSLPLFCYEGEGTLPLTCVTEKCDSPDSVSVFIGPEGGFSEQEAARARDVGMIPTGLGKRILRTETAAPFVLACVSFRYEL